MNTVKNRVQLVGNLGLAPEVKTTESGKKFARFSMATNEMRRNEQGERMKDTQWHNVIAWGSVAELVEKRLSRGSEVAIEGKLVSHSYLDKEGKKRYVTEVVVNELLLLEKKTSV